MSESLPEVVVILPSESRLRRGWLKRANHPQFTHPFYRLWTIAIHLNQAQHHPGKDIASI